MPHEADAGPVMIKTIRVCPPDSVEFAYRVAVRDGECSHGPANPAPYCLIRGCNDPRHSEDSHARLSV